MPSAVLLLLSLLLLVQSVCLLAVFALLGLAATARRPASPPVVSLAVFATSSRASFAPGAHRSLALVSRIRFNGYWTWILAHQGVRAYGFQVVPRVWTWRAVGTDTRHCIGMRGLVSTFFRRHSSVAVLSFSRRMRSHNSEFVCPVVKYNSCSRGKTRI